MPIRNNKMSEAAKALFAPRTYTHTELEYFHKNIQQFWNESRIVGDGEEARKFRWDDMAVAYGAQRLIPGAFGKQHYVATHDRFESLINLWDQYGEWRKKQDWIDEKRNVGLEKIAEEVVF